MEDPTCWKNSSYSIESLYKTEVPCLEEETQNGICLDTWPVGIDCSTNTYTLENSDASNYIVKDGCISEQKDEWFELIVPASGALSIEVPTNDTTSNLIMELYQGECDSKELISCIQSDESGLLEMNVGDLPSGDIIYLRVADVSDQFQGTFSLCINDPSLAEFRSESLPNSTDENSFIKNTKEGNIAITCYPNPTSDYVNIDIFDFDQRLDNRVSIIDSNGRVISEIKLSASGQRLDLTDLQSGVYVLKVLRGTHLSTKRLIKA